MVEVNKENSISARKDKVTTKLWNELMSNRMKIYICEVFLKNSFMFIRKVIFKYPTDKISTKGRS